MKQNLSSTRIIRLLKKQSGMYARKSTQNIVDEIKDLLAKGHDITSVDPLSGWTFFHAFTVAHVENTPEVQEIVQYAIEKGCTLTSTDHEGNTPMHLMVRSFSNNKFFEQALALGGASALNIQNNKGDTPLHVYAMYGDIDFWRAAIKHGADPYIRNNEGMTPQQAAIYSQGRLTASGYEQLLKQIAKSLESIPKPQQEEEQENHTLTGPVWKIGERKKGEAPAIRGEMTLPVEDSLSYAGLYPVDNESAIVCSERFFFSLNLTDGSIRWKQRRTEMDKIKVHTAADGIWYASIDDAGNGALAAIDPLKNFDPNTGQSVWTCIFGRGGETASVIQSGITITDDLVVFNMYSSLIAVDKQSGKLLWRAKPKGRSYQATPIVWGDYIYTQYKVKKDYFMAAINKKTGKHEPGADFPLPHPITMERVWTSSGHPKDWGFKFRRPVIYKNILVYLSKIDYAVVGIDLDTKQEVFAASMLQNDWIVPNFKDINFFVRDNILHVLTEEPVIIASFDLDKQKLLPEPDYHLEEEEYHRAIRHITPEHVYILEGGKTGEAVVNIFSRKDGKLFHSIELPNKKEAMYEHSFSSILTENEILYTYRFFENNNKPYIEILMIY